jgi:hypothetical protein
MVSLILDVFPVSGLVWWMIGSHWFLIFFASFWASLVIVAASHFGF